MANHLPAIAGLIKVPRARTGPRFTRPVREDEDKEFWNEEPTEPEPLLWPPAGTNAG